MSASLTRALFFSALLFTLPVRAWAWGSDLSFPPPAPVVDEFGLLDRAENARLGEVLRSVKQKSGVEISVFIASSLQGREIEDFSIAVAEQWKLGRKKEDKALLFVIAPKERKMRLEVGYGLEGHVTDVLSRRVLDNVMRPYFKAGRYLDGILATLVAIHQSVPLGFEQADADAYSSPSSGGDSLEGFLFFAIIVLFILFSLVSRFFGFHRSRWYGGGWGGGGFGGGSWGGGGGSSWGGGGGGFGGGGASSNW